VRSEIDAATIFLPIPVARRIGTVPTTDFFFLISNPGVLLHVIILLGSSGGIVAACYCAVAVEHLRSMPEVECQLYNLIKLSGPDAVEFLQGQLTQDVSLLVKSGQLPAAWCNPKGRVVVTVRVVRMNDDIGLIVPGNMAVRVVQRLSMYRLRSKVDISTPSEGWTDLIDLHDSDPAALIRAGVPTIDESNTEHFTPHMLNLDKLGAISFSKGCYTGQEVVARTENLGKSKRRLMRYESEGEGIQVGDKISYGERNVGEVVNVVGCDLLAVTPVELHDQILTIAGTSVVSKGLPYKLI